MSDETPANASPFTEDDIFFECPHCGKSMAIDKRGMGLTIQCPDCGGLVRVPTESSGEGGEADAVGMPPEALAQALEESRSRLERLQQETDNLKKAKESLEQVYRDQESRLKELRGEFANIQSALDHISMLLLPGDEAEPPAASE